MCIPLARVGSLDQGLNLLIGGALCVGAVGAVIVAVQSYGRAVKGSPAKKARANFIAGIAILTVIAVGGVCLWSARGYERKLVFEVLGAGAVVDVAYGPSDGSLTQEFQVLHFEILNRLS
jgi:hypothetical protein